MIKGPSNRLLASARPFADVQHSKPCSNDKPIWKTVLPTSNARRHDGHKYAVLPASAASEIQPFRHCMQNMCCTAERNVEVLPERRIGKMEDLRHGVQTGFVNPARHITQQSSSVSMVHTGGGKEKDKDRLQHAQDTCRGFNRQFPDSMSSAA